MSRKYVSLPLCSILGAVAEDFPSYRGSKNPIAAAFHLGLNSKVPGICTAGPGPGGGDACGLMGGPWFLGGGVLGRLSRFGKEFQH